MTRCHARTRSGKPCSGYAVHGSHYCFTHDPALADKRRQAHRLGGRHRRRSGPPAPFPQIDPATAQGLGAFLDKLMQDVWSLENSIDRARTLAYLIRVRKDLNQASLLESRVAALEAVLHRRSEDETA